MSYWNCGACGATRTDPTLADAVMGEVKCSNCYNIRELDDFDRRSVIDDFAEREARLRVTLLEIITRHISLLEQMPEHPMRAYDITQWKMYAERVEDK